MLRTNQYLLLDYFENTKKMLNMLTIARGSFHKMVNPIDFRVANEKIEWNNFPLSSDCKDNCVKVVWCNLREICLL
uniref:Uncharacterized protein n=1 Tax=Octopus bimaculoides TaxID=37653 RepID=A0A0L8G766_OCTBM